MNTGFSLAPLFRHSVGFDRFDELLDAALRADQSNGFPPYDIIRESDGRYRIVMAVAGFARSDIEITVKENELKIRGNLASQDDSERTWLHRGIARRAFERTFKLADHVEVDGAGLEDGLLTVTLNRIIPEEKKPRVIQVDGAPSPTKSN
ncbi:MAG: heat-shock protein [Alcanivoracaceae bacterium]|jgi:molecular chaperone IbpA|uniref:Heat-shock protein n=1 Tax=Alcanivorax profundi TaxID=2338368 RepID=A0A418Y1K1_9GAMM|nr:MULTISPECIES: Hsp20 family protein [Alcanivorax]MAX55945.1 heat-shock protein [Alcanivoracaceae bacterium]MCG8436945.1 Hsp20 family protein [Pseudomonadales bacterium]MED5431185.1 Hsp20 family protein [Pseudomonadota bacterium]ERP92861.1 heat-shock protein [Alcanivorax sp. P2S70]MEE2870436.1 Hsp20 family protein [Pseudomonadota bacterium]|tara:strand:+ start:1862 stop:2311 length:450 start_codon:yes stop_codon:yes gene_type:complete